MTKTQLALAVVASSALCLAAPRGQWILSVLVVVIGIAGPWLLIASLVRKRSENTSVPQLAKRRKRPARSSGRIVESPVKPSPTSEDDEPTPAALTLLLLQPRYVDARVVAAAASAAFGVEFQALPRDEVREEELSEQPTVFGEGPLFGVVQGDRVLLVHHQDTPAVTAEAEPDDTPLDVRLRRAVSQHEAALSVQWVGQPDEPTEAEQFRILGKLLAEFVDHDCVAVYCPTDERLSVIERSLEKHLRSADPRAIFVRRRPRAVYAVGRQDRRLKAAVDEARWRFDEFSSAFEARRSEQLFAVKAPFTRRGLTEYMWVLVGAIENGIVFGTLDNDPVDLEGLRPGDRVRVKRELVNDWMFTDGANVHGNFTLAALRNAPRRG